MSMLKAGAIVIPIHTHIMGGSIKPKIFCRIVFYKKRVGLVLEAEALDKALPCEVILINRPKKNCGSKSFKLIAQRKTDLDSVWVRFRVDCRGVGKVTSSNGSLPELKIHPISTREMVVVMKALDI